MEKTYFQRDRVDSVEGYSVFQQRIGMRPHSHWFFSKKSEAEDKIRDLMSGK